MDKSQIDAYLDENKKRFLDELIELLKIPSISADSKYKDDVKKAAEYVKQKLEQAGIDKAELCETAGHPIVYGEKMVDDSVPTILVYGHYDVQPPDPLELWNSPPFEPVIKDDKIYARGACDDKGQMYMHIKAFETMVSTNNLPCNIKFMIEGEEEVGSDNLGIFVKQNKEKLAADVILISDTSIISNNQPSITIGLRGLSYLEVELTGPNRDLHSGVYGGAVANPINTLCGMIASLKDENNQIAIPGFYDKVRDFTSDERDDINKAPFDIEAYKKELEIADVDGETGYTTLERIGIRPTLDVNGIWGGYTGEGAKTVLPAKAFAKISMRLVPDQVGDQITELFIRHMESITPATMTIKIKKYHGGEPNITPTNSFAYESASKAFKEAWGKKPIPTLEGGSIPIVALFKEELGLDAILLGFGLNSDAIHSPNENYGLFNFYKGIETIILFYKHFSS